MSGSSTWRPCRRRVYLGSPVKWVWAKFIKRSWQELPHGQESSVLMSGKIHLWFTFLYCFLKDFFWILVTYFLYSYNPHEKLIIKLIEKNVFIPRLPLSIFWVSRLSKVHHKKRLVYKTHSNKWFLRKFSFCLVFLIFHDVLLKDLTQFFLFKTSHFWRWSV